MTDRPTRERPLPSSFLFSIASTFNRRGAHSISDLLFRAFTFYFFGRGLDLVFVVYFLYILMLFLFYV